MVLIMTTSEPCSAVDGSMGARSARGQTFRTDTILSSIAHRQRGGVWTDSETNVTGIMLKVREWRVGRVQI